MVTVERRTSPRIRAYRPVRLHKPSSPQIETLTKNLSLGGVRCLSSTVFPVSSELNLELMFSTGEEPLAARGCMIWFQIVPHSEQFDLGIAFVDMAPQTKRRLSVYLDRLAQYPAAVSS